MVKRKRKVHSKPIATVVQKTFDPHERVAKKFMEYIDSLGTKYMYHSIGSNMFVRVKVLNKYRSGHYENILVKIVDKDVFQEMYDNFHGIYFNKDGLQKSKRTLKNGKMLYVNHLSLYTPEQACNVLSKEKDICSENIIVTRSHLKKLKERIFVLEKNMKNVEKYIG